MITWMFPLKQAMFFMKGPYNTLIALTFLADRHSPTNVFLSHRSIKTALRPLSIMAGRQRALQRPGTSWYIQEVDYMSWLVEVITLEAALLKYPLNSLEDSAACSLFSPYLSLLVFKRFFRPLPSLDEPNVALYSVTCYCLVMPPSCLTPPCHAGL